MNQFHIAQLTSHLSGSLTEQLTSRLTSQVTSQVTTEEQTMDIVLNGFFNHEATPSILGLQAPNFVAQNSLFMTSAQATGLQARYNVLLGIIEEIKRDVKPTYAGSKVSSERLKRNITMARFEIKNCLQELERLEG